jgi:hypothetical protein
MVSLLLQACGLGWHIPVLWSSISAGICRALQILQHVLTDLAFFQVMMHAISRDPSAFSKPCLYLQLDEGSEDMNADEEEEEEEEEEVSAEVRLVPSEDSKGKIFSF